MNHDDITRAITRQRGARSLADYERAFAVFVRDTETTRHRIELKLAELREKEDRGRALMCVAALPITRY
ncbi:hypothetical protein [Paraburkholderia youngii]|uniref:hypothetical protein n=1 Tax=Paraburkholderia youngii TaxID=2782701 RepID=UPI003D1A1A78